MYLDIPAKDFQYYRVVLVIPDIFNRKHLKNMAHILLNRLGFSSLIIHQVIFKGLNFSIVSRCCSILALSNGLFVVIINQLKIFNVVLFNQSNEDYQNYLFCSFMHISAIESEESSFQMICFSCVMNVILYDA